MQIECADPALAAWICDGCTAVDRPLRRTAAYKVTRASFDCSSFISNYGVVCKVAVPDNETTKYRLTLSDDAAMAHGSLGYDVCCLNLHASNYEFWSLAESLASSIREIVSTLKWVAVNGYVSAPGSGAPWHVDDHHVLVMQLFGSKVWDTHRVPSFFPAQNRLANVNEIDQLCKGSHFESWTLEQGDCLFVPHGCWHRTTAGSVGSISLSLRLEFKRKLELIVDSAIAAGSELGALLEVTLDPNLDPLWARQALERLSKHL